MARLMNSWFCACNAPEAAAAGLPRLVEIERGAVVVRIEQSILLHSGADEGDQAAAVELLAPPSNFIAQLSQLCAGQHSRPALPHRSAVWRDRNFAR